MYNTICDLVEKQWININETEQDYQSVYVNFKLTNSIFYKTTHVITKSSTKWRSSYFLTNTINQMLTYVDKCNKVCI